MEVSPDPLKYEDGQPIERGRYGNEIAKFTRKRNLKGLIRFLENIDSDLSEPDQFALIRAYYRFLISGVDLHELRPIENRIDRNERMGELSRVISKLDKWSARAENEAPNLAHEINRRKERLEDHLSDMEIEFEFNAKQI